MEVHNASAYLIELGLSKDEAELRHQLFRLNHSLDLRKINVGFGIEDNDDRNPFNEALLGCLENELQSNRIFQSLNEAHRKSLLKGKSPYLAARYTGNKPLPHNVESAAYNLFSYNVHSFSLGLSPMHGGSNSPASGVNLSFLAVELATIYLSNLALRYWRLRSKAIKTLNPEEKEVLNKGVSTIYLEEWLSNMQSIG